MKCFLCKKEVQGKGKQYAPGKTPEGQPPMIACPECFKQLEQKG